MRINKYLKQVAYIAKSDIDIINEDVPNAYYSKFDDSYMTLVGLEDKLKFLADREITEQLTHGVGFSPKEGKWYGWSHRAIYGFKIGSTCKKGDCHYIGSTLKEQKEAAIAFWQDEYHTNVRCEGLIGRNGNEFFVIKWNYNDSVPNEKLRNQISGTEHFITPLGKGEWTAKTMEDAKQMAIDFNEGVS